MKITKSQLRRIIKEVMEQPQLHMSGQHQNVMTQLHTAIDALIDTLGNEEARQELLGIVEDWNTEAHHENYT